MHFVIENKSTLKVFQKFCNINTNILELKRFDYIIKLSKAFF